MSMVMSNGEVSLRALEPTDLDTLYQWENDTTLWTATDTIEPYSRHILWEYLQENTGDIFKSRQLRLVIVNNDDTPVGTVDFFNFNPLNNRAEVGLFIAPEYRGHGYGKSAMLLAISYATEHIGMRQLYVYVRCDNAPCLKLFDELHFTQAGVLKQWVKRGNTYHDVALLQRVF